MKIEKVFLVNLQLDARVDIGPGLFFYFFFMGM